MDKINISHIEQYDFCPKQAENNIKGVPDLDSEALAEGSKSHEERARRFIKQSFYLTIKSQEGKERNPSRVRIKEALLWSLRNDCTLGFVEVYVESQRYGIIGYCDEVRIDRGEVSIIEYKTTWDMLKHKKLYSPPISQAKAYAQAFKEFFEYNLPVKIIINRVGLAMLKYNHPDDKDAVKPALMFVDRNYINGMWWEGFISKIYDEDYDGDFAYVESIIDNIKKGVFQHTDNSYKCSACQYKKTCDDSLYDRLER